MAAWAALVPCCLLAGCRSRPAGSSATWSGVHFLCTGWEARDKPQHARQRHGPALLAGDPPGLVELEVPGLTQVQALGVSADGRWLAVTGVRRGEELALYVVPGRGAPPQPASPNAKLMPGRQPYVFQWGPTGSCFALIDSLSRVFAGEASSGPAQQVGRARFADFVMPSDMKPPVLVWSDNGDRLAWTGVDSRLDLLDLHGVPPLHETKLAADRFVWAPGGGRLVCLTWDFGKHATRYAIVPFPEGREIAIDREGQITPAESPTPVYWSPDGTRLAVARRGYPYTELVLFREDGTRLREEKVEPGFWFFRWLTDGSGVVCARRAAPLWLVPAGPGRARQASPAIVEDPHPKAGELMGCWMPDGTLAALNLRTSRTTEFRNLSVRQSVENGEPYFKRAASIGAVSPVGRHVLVDCAVPGDRQPVPGRLLQERQFVGHTELYLCDLDTGHTKRLVVDLDGTGQQPIYLEVVECRWSPDGQLVLLSYDTPAAGRGWAVVDAATGKTTKLPIDDWSAQWIDGPRVAPSAQGP